MRLCKHGKSALMLKCNQVPFQGSVSPMFYVLLRNVLKHLICCSDGTMYNNDEGYFKETDTHFDCHFCVNSSEICAFIDHH